MTEPTRAGDLVRRSAPRGALDPRASSLETSALLERLPGVAAYELELVDSIRLTPEMRRLRCRAEGLCDLEYLPGQDLMVAVPGPDGKHFRRRYTIRHLDRAAGRLDLDIVLHGDGPGARWAATAAPGDRFEAIGPRGKITVVPDREWHLFAADESGLPATFAMLEALPARTRARVYLEVAGPREEQPLAALERHDSEVQVRWVHRGEVAPGHSTALVEELRATSLPEGTGHAYLAGELKVVAGLRKALQDGGLAKEAISSKPYWRLGVANAAHGEPDRD